ncbi:MAG: DUF4124 domain-containing protein [Thiohalomonadaceae bacterium]
MNAPLALCAALTLCLALPAQAAMYKWVDKDGSVVYSETPPPDASNVTTIAPPPLPPSPPPPREAPAEASPGQPVGDTPAGSDGQRDRARQQVEETLRKNCEIARQNLQIYRTANRILTADDNVVDLDETTRAARIMEAERDIATFCK